MRFATPSILLALLASLASLAPARLFRWDAQGDDAHRFYDALALLQSVVMPDISLTCMNYGWAHEDATTDLRGDQAYCLQLYDAVVRAAVERSFDGAAQAAVGSSAGGLLRGLDVAEIGCGRGGGAALVWDLHRPKRYVAMDASARQLSAARRRHGDASGVEFVQASFGAPLPLETDSIDVLFSIEAMHTSGRHLHRFYGEVARVLRRGGTFAFADLRNTSAGGFPMPLRASGLTPVVQADITEGVLRAAARNAFWQRIYDRARRWAAYVPGAGAAILAPLEGLLCIPGGRRHRELSEGRAAYVLLAYRNDRPGGG